MDQYFANRVITRSKCRHTPLSKADHPNKAVYFDEADENFLHLYQPHIPQWASQSKTKLNELMFYKRRERSGKVCCQLRTLLPNCSDANCQSPRSPPIRFAVSSGMWQMVRWTCIVNTSASLCKCWDVDFCKRRRGCGRYRECKRVGNPCGDRCDWITIVVQLAFAHFHNVNVRIMNREQYVLLVWKGSNYQLNLLADQRRGHNSLLSAWQSAPLTAKFCNTNCEIQIVYWFHSHQTLRQIQPAVLEGASKDVQSPSFIHPNVVEGNTFKLQALSLQSITGVHSRPKVRMLLLLGFVWNPWLLLSGEPRAPDIASLQYDAAFHLSVVDFYSAAFQIWTGKDTFPK